jgi:hypothetical protein
MKRYSFIFFISFHIVFTFFNKNNFQFPIESQAKKKKKNFSKLFSLSVFFKKKKEKRMHT